METEDLTSRLTQEAQQLKEQIASARARLDEVEALLRLTEKYVAKYENAGRLSRGLLNDRFMRQVSQRERVVACAANILSDGKSRSTRRLWTELEAHGVKIGASEPLQVLSTYLSRDGRFRSETGPSGPTWSIPPALLGEIAMREFGLQISGELPNGDEEP